MGVLGTVGIADKEDYNPSETYVIGNSVYYGGSTWVARKDNLTGITPEEGENWKYLARGFGSDNLGQIEGTDTSGVLGAVGADVVSQALIDAIADKVMTKLIPYTNIANNFLATDPKTVLSGPMGKSLKEQLDTTNSNLVPSSTVITPGGLSFGTATGYSYKIHKFGKIGILDINIVGQNVVKDTDYTIGTLGGYFTSFSAPLIASVYDKPKPAGYHLKCDNGILHIFCGQDDAAVGVSGMIPFLIP